MKYILALLVIVAGCSVHHTKSPANLQYELSFEKTNNIHVKLTYKPVEMGSTLFTYGEPRFGGQPDIIRGLTDLKVSDGSRIMFNDISREITVFYKDSLPVTIEYNIIDTHTKEQGLRGELFRPIIMNDYVYCHGINLFLNPVLRNNKLNVSQSVEWKSLPPFKLFQSFDPQNNGSRISIGRPADFMYNLITGAEDMVTDEVDIEGNRNYLVMRIIKNKDLNRKAVAEYFKQYYTGISRFWNEPSPEPYCLILQPFLSIDHNIGGMGLGSGFAGKYSYKADTILTPERIFVLSHEIGHHWIGGKIDSDINDQWFGEGFNDYFTYYTLLMTGLMTPDQFERTFNTVLESHYTARIKSLPNDSIWPNYWKMGDYNKLPYRRGSIFAFFLDNQIRKLSNGGKNIRDLMLSIKNFCINKGVGYQLSINDFSQLASEFIPADTVKAEIDRYIVKGEPIIFSGEMLVDAFSVSMKDDVPILRITDKGKFESLFSTGN